MAPLTGPALAVLDGIERVEGVPWVIADERPSDPPADAVLMPQEKILTLRWTDDHLDAREFRLARRQDRRADRAARSRGPGRPDEPPAPGRQSLGHPPASCLARTSPTCSDPGGASRSTPGLRTCEFMTCGTLVHHGLTF